MKYTLKQLEAFCVSAALGSFTDASRQLSMTQSTIAKRISELEAAVGAQLFHRSGKLLRLTAAGERLLPEAQEMMRLHQRITQALTPADNFEGHIRIGATDLVGLTWLPVLIQTVHHRYPKIRIMPEIDGGVRLYERMTANELDIAIMPGPFASPTFDTTDIGQVQNVWMASPSFALPQGVLNPRQVSSLPIIGQPENSALTVLYRNWFAEHGFALQNVLLCNSLGMVAKLTTYGLGISYLPASYFMPLVNAGRLRIVEVEPKLPLVTYYAITQHNAPPLIETILAVIQEVQDFNLDLNVLE